MKATVAAAALALAVGLGALIGVATTVPLCGSTTCTCHPDHPRRAP